MPELVSAAFPADRLRGQEQPNLQVDELTLRPWRMSDAPAVVDAYRDPEIQRWHVRAMDEAEAQGWVKSWAERWTAENGAGWAIVDSETLVGRMTFRWAAVEAGSAEVAYWTVPAARGRNVAGRALGLASGWMLTGYGLHRLELNHSMANSASCRVATKAGYVYEGTRRRQGLHLDGWHDMHLHALLAEDLPDDGT